MAVVLSRHHFGSCAPWQRQRSKTRHSNFMAICCGSKVVFLLTKSIESSSYKIRHSEKNEQLV